MLHAIAATFYSIHSNPFFFLLFRDNISSSIRMMAFDFPIIVIAHVFYERFHINLDM